MAKAYGFPWPTATNPCALCKCNTSTAPWTEAKINTSLWQRHRWTSSTWLEAHPRRHSLLTLPGVSIYNYMPDLMHVLHLGAYQYTFGSILEYVTTQVMTGSQEDNTHRLWQGIHQYYMAHADQISASNHM